MSTPFCTFAQTMENENWFVSESSRNWLGETRRATGLLGRRKNW